MVDTGGWLPSKKFIVPADRLQASAKHEDDYEVSLNKAQIESFPPYNESDLESENKWADYEERYRAKWVTVPCMHRAETDRNITPTTQQTSGKLESERAEARTTGREGYPPPNIKPQSMRAARTSKRLPHSTRERAVPAGTDSVVIDNSAKGIGGRWDTFQSRLRERRKEVCNPVAIHARASPP